jgi:Tol biopolymer transport system component
MHSPKISSQILIRTLCVALALVAISRPVLATFHGENGKIVFVGNQSGTWQLYTMNADGRDMMQITHMPSTNFESWLPVFSPDGKHILFSHDSPENPCLPNGPPTCVDLYVINADGSGMIRLTKNGLSSAGTWSPNASRIVFNHFSTLTFINRVATMRADGKGAETNLSTAFWDSGFALYTPDGTHLVFYSEEGGFVSAVWIMDTDGRNKRRLTSAALEGGAFDVSPDGRHILVVNHVNTSLPTSIYVMNIDGSDLTRLTHPPDKASDIGGTYSPDGEKIVFISSRFSSNQSLDIFTMNSDGTDIRRIASGVTVGGCPDGNCVTPSWGPKPGR